MKLQPQDVALVLGIRGSGKSRWTKANLCAKPARLVVFDPQGEYGSPTRSLWPLVPEVADLVPMSVERLAELVERNDLPERVAVRPESSRGTHVGEAFEDLCDLAECLTERLVVVEEAGLVQRHASEALDYLATQSRHWRVPLALVAQRPVQLSPTVREQASVVVVHKLTRRSDLEILADRIGESKACAAADLARNERLIWTEEEDFSAPPKGRSK